MVINVRGSRRRLALTVLVVFAIVAVFVVRLVDIQVVRADALTAEADKRRINTVTTYGVRGSIVDAQGDVLADSVERFDITASPKNAKLDTTWMTKNGERVREPGILESFNLDPADAELLIMRARVVMGWVEAPEEPEPIAEAEGEEPAGDALEDSEVFAAAEMEGEARDA